MDDLQIALAVMKQQLSGCAALAAPAEAMDHSKIGHAMPGMATPAPAPAQEAIDPVCGMTVDPKSALQATHQGKTYYFCSEEDRQKFLKEPGKYVKRP